MMIKKIKKAMRGAFVRWLTLGLMAATAVVAPALAQRFLGNPTAVFTVYVSSIDANGIPVGDDATCTGTIQSPCLTWDKAYALMPFNGTLRMNGTLASIQTYGSTTSTTIGGSPVSTYLNKSGTFEAVVPGSVILSGGGTAQAVAVGASGVTINLNGVIIDPSVNFGGAAPVGIFLIGSPFATAYTFNMSNVTFRNWTTFGITAQRTLDMSGTWDGLTLNGGSVTAAIYIPFWRTGDVLNLTNSACTISNASVQNFGACFHAVAVTAGPLLNLTNYSTSVTTTATAGSFFDMRTVDAVVHISNGTHSCTTGVGTSGCTTLTIQRSQFDISGSTITNPAGLNPFVTMNTNSGLPCIIGQDSITDRLQVQNVVIDACNSLNLGSAGTEGPILGSATNGIIRNSTVTGFSIVAGAKDCKNCQFLNNTGINTNSLGLVDKGNTGSIFSGNATNQTTSSTPVGFTIETNSDTQQNISAITQANPGQVTVTSTAGYHNGDSVLFTSVGGMTQLNGNNFTVTVVDATHFTIGVDTTSFGAYTSGGTSIIASSGGTYTTNTFVNNGATGGFFINWQVGNSITSIDHNTYNLISGTMAGNQFVTPGANFATCPLYKAAIEPTAVCLP